MTPKQLAAIEKHGRQLLAIFPNATEQDPVKLCKKLRRIEGEAHRHAERMCSDERYYNEWTSEDGERDLKDERLERRLRKLLGSDRPFLNGDPRGYALKVDLLPERECDVCETFRASNPDLPYETWCLACQGESRLPAERLHTDWGGYGIIAPEIGPEGE